MDVRLCETGSGGDYLWKGKDFDLTGGFSNDIYLGIFGGNINDTERDREDIPASEQRFNWWGNELLFGEQQTEFKFNSELETLLKSVALTSGSRIKIEEAILGDLDFFEGFQ